MAIIDFMREKITLNPKINVRDSPIEGKGLFAKESFKKGENFQVTHGKHSSIVMTKKEFEAYKKTVKSWDSAYIGGGKYRVSTLSREEDPSNFGNHSCDPNIAPIGDAVIALRDISVDEELTVDYAQFSRKDWRMECSCDAINCPKTVNGIL